MDRGIKNNKSFNTQPPEGGWQLAENIQNKIAHVSTHSRLKAAGKRFFINHVLKKVSTHSRLKAAGAILVRLFPPPRCFNTQPPEGGWVRYKRSACYQACFNTQPPEGGWFNVKETPNKQESFNTQPPEGGWVLRAICFVRFS